MHPSREKDLTRLRRRKGGQNSWGISIPYIPPEVTPRSPSRRVPWKSPPPSWVRFISLKRVRGLTRLQRRKGSQDSREISTPTSLQRASTEFLRRGATEKAALELGKFRIFQKGDIASCSLQRDGSYVLLEGKGWSRLQREREDSSGTLFPYIPQDDIDGVPLEGRHGKIHPLAGYALNPMEGSNHLLPPPEGPNKHSSRGGGVDKTQEAEGEVRLEGNVDLVHPAGEGGRQQTLYRDQGRSYMGQ